MYGFQDKWWGKMRICFERANAFLSDFAARKMSIHPQLTSVVGCALDFALEARSKTFSRPTMFRTRVSQVFSGVEIHFSGAFGDLWVLRSRLDFALGKVKHVHGGQSPTISRWSAALFRNWNAGTWTFTPRVRYENTFSRYFGGFAVCIRKLWSSHVHHAVSGASG